MDSAQAPVLSTPAEYILEDGADDIASVVASSKPLDDEQLYVQYELRRTVEEIRAAKHQRVALQFPDDMLVDAPRVYERLRDDLNKADPEGDVTLCILGDTSYGACCVDEVAAEHVEADAVVHYGRSCLSPTARLPVIYVFTSRPLDIDTAVASFVETYKDSAEKICLLADIPYTHHLEPLARRLRDDEGYVNLFVPEIIPDPSSLLPNRTVPDEVKVNPEALQEYSVFHLSSPPTSLLLILSSRIKNMHIFATDASITGDQSQVGKTVLEATTAQLLRRRYALITRLSTVPIFGILINTLSVSNYMAALQHCQRLIANAGKKSYVFVVGKVNAAKVANFSEIGGWVVIGCWESSLLESKDFYRPIITPFELELALTDDDARVWRGEWIGDFATVLARNKSADQPAPQQGRDQGTDGLDRDNHQDQDYDENASDDEPPEFDLRTGRYVSHSRPMGRPRRELPQQPAASSATDGDPLDPPSSSSSSALVARHATRDVATIAGQVSPAAEFLRSQRTWQGLGHDHASIAYERDGQGNIVGAAMEEGRSGIARGYTVGEEAEKH
jgi:diphthamide biosynthesis protein 2